MRSTCLRAAAAAFFSLSASATSAQDVAQTMRDWWVECGPQGYCVAEVNGFSQSYDAVTLRLQRSEEGHAPILVSIRPERPVSAGQRFLLEIPETGDLYDGTVDRVSDGAFTVPFDPQGTLIQGMRDGPDLFVTIFDAGGTGQVTYTVPLSGAVDSLTVMDIAQLRLGREDAVITTGPMPADSWSDPFPGGGDETDGEDMGGVAEDGDTGDAHMEEGPNGSWFDLVYAEGDLPDEVLMPGYRVLDCKDLAGSIGQVGAGITRDQRGRMWYAVPCAIGKANVQYYVVLHAPNAGHDHDLLMFQLPPAENKPDRAGILNPVIRADEDTIIATRYGNMNRNCGAYEIHRLNPDDGRLELNAYYEKRDCGGAQVAPKDFPLVFTLDEMGD